MQFMVRDLFVECKVTSMAAVRIFAFASGLMTMTN
jgi:hypothetical protein